MFALSRSTIISTVAPTNRRVFHSTLKSFQKSPTSQATASTQAITSSGNGGSGIFDFARKNPFLFQLGVATLKTAGADIMAQMVVEKKSFAEIDWKRHAVFVVFGFTYLGGFQYYLMVHKYRQWFPTMDRFAQLSVAAKLKDTAGIMDAGKMVLFDVLFHIPILYYPSYYTVKEFVFGYSWNPVDWVQGGVSCYFHNLKDDLIAGFKVWLPSDCIQFVLPVHLRMPYRHCVSFLWTAYLSFARGAADPVKREEEEA